MEFQRFWIDGFDYLDKIGRGALIERTPNDGGDHVYELTVTRADPGPEAWLGGYKTRMEFNLDFIVADQRATGRWRRREYDGNTAIFISVGDINFTDAPGKE